MLKSKVCAFIDKIGEELEAIALDIHRHPELGFEEEYAVELLTEKLEEYDFDVKTGVADLPTAILATHSDQSEGPIVAILAEYDALPELGHGCGHNLIATAALGAVLGIGSVKEELPGTILFMGTPAEEEGGGKIIMINAGLFDNVDAALMFHPSAKYTGTGRRGLAMTPIKIWFHGKPAHAASCPEKGISALDAVMLTFTGINYLREHIRDDGRIHGIVTHGGEKPNIVPEYAEAEFYIRAKDDTYRDELLEKVINCAKGAALMTGAEMEWEQTGPSYGARNVNRVLGKAFEENLKEIGEPLIPFPEDSGVGSSDIGNVSQVAPAIHPYIRISEEEIAGHSQDFTQAAASPLGLSAMISAAKGLAMTAIDIFTNKEIREAMKKEFQEASSTTE
jgi:amidohydrolase